MDQNYRKMADQGLLEDMPRLVRRDVTELSSSIAQYEGLKALVERYFNDSQELTVALTETIQALAAARRAVQEAGLRLQGVNAPTMMAADDEELTVENHQDAEDGVVRIDVGGKALPIATALQRVGLASSTVVGRRAVRNGGVFVDGEAVTNPNSLVEPGGVHELELNNASRHVRFV